MGCVALISVFVLLQLITNQCAAQIPDSRARADKACAICHLEWAAQAQRPEDFVLLPSPGKPIVAESDNCLGCHDGSVGDSRRPVWLEHGHRTGVALGLEMRAPAELPLDNGKVSCRTCHTAHVSGFNESLKDAVFLRMKNDQDQLCKTCHEDKSKGPQTGSHPLAAMKSPAPPILISAGAHTGSQNTQVICQSCHAAHGAKANSLLLMPVSSSELCITCHVTMRPAMWDTNPAHDHPQNPLINRTDQLQAIRDMKRVLGEGNRLVCMSCHKMHGGQAGRAMLADTLKDSAMCIRCHADLRPMLGTAHDLRNSAPGEKNIRAQTPEQSGPCAACHTFHSYTRTPGPKAGDPQGLCTTCHSKDQVASKHTGTMFHPVALDSNRLHDKPVLRLFPSVAQKTLQELACTSCHNPHETKHPHFLRSAPEQLCASCHSDQAKTLSEPHDFSSQPQFKNGLGQTPQESGRCGFCHSMHQAKGPMMLAATDRPIQTMDDACAQCHAATGLAAKHPLSKFNHPSGPDAKLKGVIANLSLPLFGGAFKKDPRGAVVCSSCHDVHAGKKQSNDLLRAGTPTALCIQCHQPQGTMSGGPHDPKVCKKPFPEGVQKTDDLCLTCHRAHGNEPDRQLWTLKLPSTQSGSDAACVSCHRDQAWSSAANATRPGELLHPKQVPTSSKTITKAANLPLTKLGKPDSPAELSCSTCHDPHAPPKIVSLLRISESRPAADVCGQCHAEAQSIVTSMHRPEEMADHIAHQDACAPCHQVHGSRGTQRKLLWTTRVMANAASESERLCLGCHSATGGAKVPTAISHPPTYLKDLRTATTRPSTLVDQFGKISQLTCSTCHESHGREIPEHARSGASELTREKLVGMKTMLRPNVEREICAACHGADAPQRYLYFHDPRKRK